LLNGDSVLQFRRVNQLRGHAMASLAIGLHDINERLIEPDRLFGYAVKNVKKIFFAEDGVFPRRESESLQSI
jgi:hypothetical protein